MIRICVSETAGTSREWRCACMPMPAQVEAVHYLSILYDIYALDSFDVKPSFPFSSYFLLFMCPQVL
jgi:hypothetical protein